jgi:serine/threonine protein kinase
MTETESPPPLSLVSHIDALPAGTRLAEFEVLELLGVGGFGMVYKAFDHSLQRLVAIKEYMPSALAGRSHGMTVSMKSSADAQTFMAGLKSFVAEARLLAQFDHPSLVKVFRFWEANNTAYMVMPLYSGVTFKQARNHMRSPPPEAWLRKVLWSVLGALHVLHDGNTMHRDVSPDNIFLQDNGPPVLLDLGAARRAISDKSQKHTAILKVNYAPIEQYADAEDMRQGPWTDLYSLAAVMHGCLCNEPPVPATFRVLKDRMPSFANVAATVQEQFGLAYSDSFVGAISHALAIRPEQRPQSVEQFSQELALETPSGMARFDWRAELGDIWLPAGMQSEEARALLTTSPALHLPTQLLSTTTPGSPPGREASGLVPEVELPGDEDFAPAVTRPMPNATPVRRPLTGVPRDVEAVPTEPSPLLPSGEAPPARRGLGLAIAAGVVLLAGAGFWAWTAMNPSRTEPPAAVVPAAEPPAAVAQPADNPQPVAETKAEVAVPASAAMPAVQAAAASAAKPASAPIAAASAPPKRIQPSSAATLAATPPPASVRPAATDTKAIVVTEQPSAPPPRPAVAARPSGRSEGESAAAKPASAELCADSNLFSRPMCLYRECQKPELAGLAVCIEQKRRYQNQTNPQSQ